MEFQNYVKNIHFKNEMSKLAALGILFLWKFTDLFEYNEEQTDVMKSTLNGFVWPMGVMALKFVGASNPILFAGNILGAAYTFKDVPDMVYSYFNQEDE